MAAMGIDMDDDASDDEDSPDGRKAEKQIMTIYCLHQDVRKRKHIVVWVS